ncbi:hypothetical protein K493DRAFT_86771 [Basidiobolus meristosporus CBS 931.73]|uniref:MICOS complex subunit n=1 Tax=Basidiobolus meristosporus CBS 931.73 TaxID=1314790 RepID=A0A1Y1XGA9_9FUNG|nr:hypothetical protein K493DRAFT_86771 [Basidiobolus meristosporus CBS 931.73]|eukprot:ORX84785.1 hypothetical protein K493DRAFT_86771 [Basidiobolus meristosporus CBS 931.73]
MFRLTNKIVPSLLLVGSVAGASRPTQIVHCEAKEEPRKESKLRIYDEQQEHVLIVEEPTKLEETIRDFRIVATQYLQEAQARTQEFLDECYKTEKQIESNVSQVIPKHEKLMPGSLYVLVAGLAGSIASRNKNFLLRTIYPLTFATASSFYFLPETSRAVFSTLRQKIEEHPAAQEQIKLAKEQMQQLKVDVNSKVQETVENIGIGSQVTSVISQVRETVEKIAPSRSAEANVAPQLISEETAAQIINLDTVLAQPGSKAPIKEN